MSEAASAIHTRVPLPPHIAFERMNLAGSALSPEEALERVQLEPTVLQDFRPLTSCLEWELSQLHWNQSGLLPFVENHVPFLINNSGRLSEHAAATLFANCLDAPGSEPIRVLELGAGTGLFALYFLDAFFTLCKQESKDFYDRLIFYVTDQSPRTVDQWQERHLFDKHGKQRVVLGCCDALKPSRVVFQTREEVELEGLQAVFCNYVLDVLPATVVKKGSNGPEELQVRTHLTRDRGLLTQYTRLTPENIRDIARSDYSEEKTKLVPLISLLEIETSFMPLHQESRLLSYALALDEKTERVLLNYGAITCLDVCMELLCHTGFILINDYGPVRRDEVANHSVSQRFGPTSATGINFPFLEQYFAKKCAVVTPDGDERRGIHSRLMVRSDVPGTVAAYQNRFGQAGYDFFEVPVEEARAHLSAGRKTESLESYRLALSRAPHDWHVVGEIAEFVGLQLQDYQAGRQLIRAALDQNPWYSAWLWNVLGDILFLDRDVSGAHEAYLQAQRIHPRDARTNLNLAYTFFEFGEYANSLEALASAMGADVAGMYRPRLLEKQHQVLGAISGRWIGEQERLTRRVQRML